MFREKLIKGRDRGYLYIRDSVYVRDRRTIRKKPKKFGNGSGSEQRGQYSKKKDIYCGKIIEVDPVNLITFNDYLNKINLNFNDLNNYDFDKLLNIFVEYVLYIYNLSYDEFYSKHKRVYTIGNGYMSPITLKWFKNFNIKNNYYKLNEYNRFYNRAIDVGIFNDDIIEMLYIKMIPDSYKEDIKEEIRNLKLIKLKNIKTKFKDFIEK